MRLLVTSTLVCYVTLDIYCFRTLFVKPTNLAELQQEELRVYCFFFCQAQSQLQLNWTELALFLVSPHPPPPPPTPDKYQNLIIKLD